MPSGIKKLSRTPYDQVVSPFAFAMPYASQPVVDQVPLSTGGLGGEIGLGGEVTAVGGFLAATGI